jgi:hypothetical protein
MNNLMSMEDCSPQQSDLLTLNDMVKTATETLVTHANNVNGELVDYM